ncbi:hypothetical protein [Streptomyces sp. CBMA123]|uniref:hypothetical protein n=1 Tax=Streptomyces sp. CBMA123 TaxID=1896313 RepID=UPI0016620DE1|nr:hypothetical protein [Streptomyces sp. CBMA123]
MASLQLRSDRAGVGFVTAAGTGFALAGTEAVHPLGAFLIALTVAAAALFATPYTFWLRADEQGVTLVRYLLPRRFAWSELHGLAMEFGEEVESGRHHLTLRLWLADPPGRVCGPLLGKVTVTDEDTPAGVPPRSMAELFALFGERGLPVEEAEFANEVLRVRGLPPLRPLPGWVAPAEGAPAPERAYADAPGIEEEARRVEALRTGAERRARLRREYLLRHAALSDRVFLRDGDGLALAIALRAAGQLVEHDRITVEGDQRHYVRRQYLNWRALNP